MLKTTRTSVALTRRTLGIAALCGVVARPARALTLPPHIMCRVIRGGHDIGSAVYAFQSTGGRLSVSIDVEIRIRIGFITLFRYAHTNAETWDGEQLIGFQSHTKRNSETNFATATWNGSALQVTGSAVSPYAAPPGAIGTSFWNPRTLKAPLINAENGRMPRVQLAAAGPSQAVLSTGAKVAADEYKMTGDLRLNLWYDASNTWAGMQYYAHDGSVLTYEKS